MNKKKKAKEKKQQQQTERNVNRSKVFVSSLPFQWLCIEFSVFDGILYLLYICIRSRMSRFSHLRSDAKLLCLYDCLNIRITHTSLFVVRFSEHSVDVCDSVHTVCTIDASERIRNADELIT